jgi:hypothetical protein
VRGGKPANGKPAIVQSIRRRNAAEFDEWGMARAWFLPRRPQELGYRTSN